MLLCAGGTKTSGGHGPNPNSGGVGNSRGSDESLTLSAGHSATSDAAALAALAPLTSQPSETTGKIEPGEGQSGSGVETESSGNSGHRIGTATIGSGVSNGQTESKPTHFVSHQGGRFDIGPSAPIVTGNGGGASSAASAATSGNGRKATLPVHALVHAFHCTDDRCVQKTCAETKGVLKRMRLYAAMSRTPNTMAPL